jgi:predicted RNase H-like HicB family nuclease
MAAKSFLVVIEEAESNYCAYAPDLPGCVATGKTREEVERNMQEALEMHLRGLAEDEIAIPTPSARSEYFSVPARGRTRKASRTPGAGID